MSGWGRAAAALVLAGSVLVGGTAAIAAPAPAAAAAAVEPAGAGQAPACAGSVRKAPRQAFDPRTSSDAALKQADFPARPSDPADLAQWRHYADLYRAGKVVDVSNCASPVEPVRRQPARTAPAVTAVAAQAARTFDNSYNWCGNIVNSAGYTDAEVTFRVPSPGGQRGDESSHWVGIGLGQGRRFPLVQSGIETLTGIGAYAWVETYYAGATGSQYYAVPLYVVHPGDVMYIHLEFDQNGRTAVQLTDETTGVVSHRAPYQYPGMRPDGHAEWITERQLDRGFNNFGAETMTDAQAWSPTTKWKYVGQLSHHYTSIWDRLSGDNTPPPGSRQLCYPGAISRDARSFATHWLART